MSFPASLTVVSITGTFLDGEGLPRSGSVVFRTPGFTMSAADDTFIIPRTMTVDLDASGHFEILVPSTTDPQWTPVGWTYRVTVDFGDDGKTLFGDVVVPHDLGAELSLAALAPVPLSGGLLYALYNDPRFDGIGGGGGSGAVNTVFGRSGNVTAQTGDYTKVQVGLSNVDNTSDATKPVSTAQANADSAVASAAASALTSGLAGKANSSHSHVQADVTGLTASLAAKEDSITAGSTAQYLRGDKTWQTLNKTAVGLSNVDNTSDAGKPISTLTATALASKADLVGGVLATSQIPAISVVDFLGTPASQAAMLALTGQKGDFVIRTDTNTQWTITGSDPTQLSSWTQIPTGIAAVSSVNAQTGVVVLSKTDIGLANVDNTSDAGKPVSTAQATAIALKANLAGPTFTGVPAAPTATAGTSTTQLATTAFVTVADALKANLASPTFTGTPAAPTPAVGTNTTQIATTAFVGANTRNTQTFCFTGTAVVTAGKLRWFNRTGKTLTVVGAWVSAATAPTGAAILVDVNKNGTTMFTTQANRPTVAVSGNGGVLAVPDVTTIADGDYLTVDVDQIGSTVAGADLAIGVVYW